MTARNKLRQKQWELTPCMRLQRLAQAPYEWLPLFWLVLGHAAQTLPKTLLSFWQQPLVLPPLTGQEGCLPSTLGSPHLHAVLSDGVSGPWQVQQSKSSKARAAKQGQVQESKGSKARAAR